MHPAVVYAVFEPGADVMAGVAVQGGDQLEPFLLMGSEAFLDFPVAVAPPGAGTALVGFLLGGMTTRRFVNPIVITAGLV